MKKHILKLSVLFFATGLLFIAACNSNNNQVATSTNTDSTTVDATEMAQSNAESSADSLNQQEQASVSPANEAQAVVMIYNFHVTNRCVSCIAIQDATTKALNTYFAAEVKQGRIKQYILNVDDEANSKIAEKYQAFGSGLFVTRVFKGKETTTDLTGDGFKFARNKETRFMEILKKQISEYLK